MSRRRASALTLSPPTAITVRKIARAWELFVTGNETSLSDVPPLIRDAWLRSKSAGVDPALPSAPRVDTPTDLATLREEIDWLSRAEPVLAFLQNVLTEPHQLLMLSDDHGRVLFSAGGTRAMAKAEQLGAVPGGEWQENKVGCTVLGTSIAVGIPVQVSWHENYGMNWQDWVNQSAPIRDPLTHRILGAIGIAGYREISHPQALALVTNAAVMIEAAVHEQGLKARLAVLEHFSRLASRYPADGLVAVDRYGYILALNPLAEKILSSSSAQLVGRRLNDISPLRERLGSLLSSSSLFVINNQAQTSGVTILPTLSGRSPGAVLVIDQSAGPVKAPTSQPWATSFSFADLVGQSQPFRACLELAAKMSQYDWPVLLRGESGTGKELFAQAIHAASPRRHGPFVAFSCASISDDLIGAELFGYSEGAFTGGLKGGNVGKIQLAHTGTLFLDDIDGMPAKMQLSLLRVLEEKRVVPLGARVPQSVDIRVIAASNCDLEQAIHEGRFRPDLYHRLNVLSLTLPPLRERSEDISLLARHILAHQAPDVTLTDEALTLLTQYAWPGNIRELRNVLLGASVRAENGCITPADLPPAIGQAVPALERVALDVQSLKESETQMIERALQQTGSVQQAATLLGLHYSTLYRKLKKAGIALPPGEKKNAP